VDLSFVYYIILNKMTLREYLSLTPEEKFNGVFIRGDENDGEFKRWWDNGQFYEHCFYKDGKKIKDYLK